APALGRDAAARLDRAGARDRPADSIDGRALRRARRDHPRSLEPGVAEDLGGDRHHDRLRHAQHSRGRVSREPRLRVHATAGPSAGRSRHRAPLAARPFDEGHAGVPPPHGDATPRAGEELMTARSPDAVLVRRIVLPLVVIAGLVILWDVAIRAVAIPPIFVLMLGNGYSPKIAIAALITFFPTLVNMVEGLESADPQALELMHVLSASRTEVFRYVRWPSSLPYLFSAMRIASTS